MKNDKTKAYEAELMEVIKKQKIMRFDHAFAFTSFSRATAYNHGLDKIDDIKDAITKNRLTGTNYLLQKWIASDNPTLQIAAMRLICSSDEHRALNQKYVDAEVKRTVNIIDIWGPDEEE